MIWPIIQCRCVCACLLSVDISLPGAQAGRLRLMKRRGTEGRAEVKRGKERQGRRNKVKREDKIK